MLPGGKVSVSYVKSDNTVELFIKVPEGLDAALEFGGSRETLSAGEHRFVSAL